MAINVKRGGAKWHGDSSLCGFVGFHDGSC
jgi:hypothetical protein